MEETYKGYTIKIEQDDVVDSPREWDNLGEIIAKHRDYKLADDNVRIDAGDYSDANELHDDIVKAGGVVIMPLYLLDHSGLWLSTGRYDCDPQGWDTSMVGFIAAFRDSVLEEYGVKRITKAILAKVTAVLENEVEIYGKYLTGDVVMYAAINPAGDVIGSCCGYYDRDDAIKEARAAIDNDIEQERIKHNSKLRAYITNRVPLNKRVF